MSENPYNRPPTDPGEPGANGQQPPQYGQQAPQYGQPAPPYGAQPPAYGTGQQSYGAPGAYNQPYPGGQNPNFGGYYPDNGLAGWSLGLAIAGIFMCGFLSSIPAIILGTKAKRAVAEGRANNGGMATAGLVIGWIVTILTVLGVIAGIWIIAQVGSWEEFLREVERDMDLESL